MRNNYPHNKQRMAKETKKVKVESTATPAATLKANPVPLARKDCDYCVGGLIDENTLCPRCKGTGQL